MEATPPTAQSLYRLKDLVLIRRRFVDERADLGRLASELESKAGLRQVRLQLRCLANRVAALDRDKHQGRRHVRGGRTAPRRAMYMARLAAVRFNPPQRDFYRRFREAGKEHNVALVAVMRKLVILANVLLQQRSPLATPTATAAEGRRNARMLRPPGILTTRLLISRGTRLAQVQSNPEMSLNGTVVGK